MIAFCRCLLACSRARLAGTATPLEPIFFAATLVMYLSYARVDLAVVAARASVPLAVVLALVLMRPWANAEEKQ